jgi:hypothetical protein
MHKRKILKGQAGLPLNYNLGLSPSTQKSLQEILSGSNKLKYSTFDPATYKSAQTSIEKIDLGYKGLNTSSPLASLGKTKGATSLKGISGAGAAIEVASGLVPKYDNESELTNKANTAYDTTASTLAALPTPEAKIAGYGMKALGALDDGINNLTDGASTINNPLSKVDAVTSSKWKWLSTPTIAYSAINSATKHEIDDSDKYLTKGVTGYNTREVEGGEVGGITNQVSGMFRTAKKNIADKGLFGSIKSTISDVKDKGISGFLKSRTKENEENSIATKRENRVNLADFRNLQKKRESSKAQNSSALGQTNFRDTLSKNAQQLQGVNPLLYAKNGASLNKVRKIKKEVLKKLEKPIEFKDGGKVNVIPEGKLHSRLNEHNEKEITKKGIPVVIYKDGEAIQHAEIEKEELIINSDLTKKVEDLKKKYKESDEDKYLIEVGKLFSEDILENTEDNVNLIED